jgi:hypothetical protein
MYPAKLILKFVSSSICPLPADGHIPDEESESFVQEEKGGVVGDAAPFYFFNFLVCACLL